VTCSAKISERLVLKDVNAKYGITNLGQSGKLSDAENFFFGGCVVTRQKKFFHWAHCRI